MKSTFTFLLFILTSCCSFAQAVKWTDFCNQFQKIRSVSPAGLKNATFDSIQLDQAALMAINKATLLALNEGETCAIGNDESLFSTDFSTESTKACSIIRISNARAVNNNVWVFMLTTENDITYLITFSRNEKRQNCIEGKSAVLLTFRMGNNHWGSGRSAVFQGENKINIEGDCWHENEQVGSFDLKTTVVIKKDGTMEVVE